MSAEKIIKAQARDKLGKGTITKALIGLAVISMVYLMIDAFAALKSVIINVLSPQDTALFITEVFFSSVLTILCFLFSPIILSYIKMFATDNDSYDTNDIFYYFSSFKRYCKAIVFIFSFIFRMIIPTALSFSPVIIWLLLKAYILPDFSGDTFITILLIVSAVLFTLRYSVKYFLSFYLMCKDESKPIPYYFNESKAVMREHSRDIVKLTLSFIGWFLLCITVLPLLYVLPYFVQTMCISAKWLSQLKGTEN